MRILVVHNYYQHKGGEDVVFHQEVEALKKDHQVETITFQNRKGLQGLVQFALYPWNIFAAAKILRKAREFRVDIVHIHNLHYAIGPLVIRRLHQSGFKMVNTLHNYRLLDPSATLFAHDEIFLDTIDKEFPWKSVKMKSLDNSFFKTFWVAFTYYLHKKLGTWKQINKYLVFSKFMKTLILKSSKNIEENQIALKVNAIEPTALKNHTESNSFVFIGRLSIEKGIKTLLVAFVDRPDYNLEIYGDGPLIEEVKNTANNSNNIQYRGFQNKEVLNQALASSQALIVPSVWFEGMPMTVLEAYAAGTPVIASKIGVLDEMIINGETGFHFAPGEVESLITILDKFSGLSDQSKQVISKNCIKEYNKKYTLENNIKSLEMIYTTVLNNN
ncbi:glycosyltransferase family 4 protein [Sphingobacterium bovisgrunnientis]|uniref:glycosyltransferase family 4 protein n=1 Tax=Sphingobacterium bovisgrunnientis TaxID=1874697 RepID=UPI00135A5674|nr:glycosyltransferase family 4 protein [Sphingobacterium bovisgrunnientis]